MVSFNAPVLHGDAKENYRKTPHHSKHQQQHQQQRPHLGSNDSSNENLFAAGGAYEEENEAFEGKRARNEDVATSDLNLQQQQPPAKKFAAGSDIDIASDLVEIMDVDENGPSEEDETSNAADEAAKSKEEEDAQEEWNILCERILNEPEASKHRHNLEIFLSGMQRREAAQEALEKAHAVAQASLDAIHQNVLAYAIPVHEKIFDKMLLAEQDLLHHFGSNHAVRQAVLQTLHGYNDQWQRKYEGYLSRILPGGDDKASPFDLAQDKLASDNCENPKENSANETTMATDQARSGDDAEEPDWEALVAFDPSSRDKIHLFLDGRDRWQAACQQFSNALDEIHEQLKESHANVLRSIEQAYSRICDDLDEQQVDIKFFIVSNCQRRDQLEKALEETAKQQQSMFARLMARVGGGGGGFSSSQPQQAATDNFTGGGGFLSLNPLSHVFQRGSKRAQP